MFPCEEIANGLQRDAAVFPFIGQHTKRRREKGIVTKLIDTDFRGDYWQCCNVSKPGCFTSSTKGRQVFRRVPKQVR